MSTRDVTRHADHVIDVGVMDDTSTKHLVDTSSPAGGTEIIQIMNTVRALHVHFRDPDTGNRLAQSLSIPTAYNSLSESKTEDLHSSFIHTSLVSALGIGSYFKRLHVDPNIFDDVEWKTLVVIGDALKANDALCDMEKATLLLVF